MRDLKFYLANTPPLPVPAGATPRCSHYYSIARHVATPVCLVLQKLEYLLVKIDWERLATA